MSDLLVRPSPTGAADGTILSVTPDSAGWAYVGFEVLAVAPGMLVNRSCGERELCVVVVSGTVDVISAHGEWRGLGGRADPWSGPPDAAYLPPRTEVSISGSANGGAAEVALCWAPAPSPDSGPPARRLLGSEVTVETRGYGNQERFVAPILMGDREAQSLLVCEVRTPAGHWSSYPPHKHDRDDPPRETFLEETYYHRVRPARGFALQRVYSQDGSLDETLAVADRHCVLVPRGYHTVSAPPGYELYYLNVMAGPTRLWVVANDPDHAWTLRPAALPPAGTIRST